MSTYQNIMQLLINYRPFKKKLGYFGWTGFGNLGDEALFEAVKYLFLINKASVMNHLRFAGKGKFVQNLLEDRVFDGMLLGAGTLINSRSELNIMQSLQKKRKKTFVIGTGVLEPDFYKNSGIHGGCMGEWVDVLNRSEKVFVRGPLSKEILESHGCFNASVCGDPVLAFAENRITEKKMNKRIGINLCLKIGDNSLWWGSDADTILFVRKICKIMLEKQYKVILFPFMGKDIIESKKIMNDFNGMVSVYDSKNNYLNFLKKVKEVDLFIGVKLHSVILSLCTYTPSIMLSYTPKGEDFMKSIDLMEFSMRTSELDTDRLLHMINTIESDVNGYQQKVFHGISRHKKTLVDCSRQIVNCL